MTPASPDRGTNLSRRRFIAATVGAGALAAIEGCAPGGGLFRSQPPFDLLISGGTVLDGTGAAAMVADVAIRDGRIAAIGTFAPESAGRVIEAKGLCVAPGFIDIHSHVDTSLFRHPLGESKLMQGVTTEASGMDGESAAPQRPKTGPPADGGEDPPYRNMAGYLDRLAEARPAQNIVTFVGLGSVREVVVGEDDVPATPGQMEDMKRLVRESIEQGACGVSTGLEYTPGSYASTAELAEVLSAAPEKYRIYATHMRNEGDTLVEAIEEAIAICRSAGARLQVSHLKAQNKRNWGKAEKVLELLEEAIAGGLDVHADRYPYLAFSTGLASLFPLWSRDGGGEKFLARLRDPEQKQKIREAVEWKVEGLSSWDAVMITSVATEENRPAQGKTILQLAKEAGREPYDFAVELMLKEEGRVGMVGFGMDEPGTERILAWRNTMIASDGGAYYPGSDTSPHPRTYGTFPRALAFYCRERKIMTLPEMVRRMTSLPAAKLGLADRGVLSAGKAADCVLFDPLSVRDRATYADPHQFPEGIPHVIINGVQVVENGRPTGERPGMVIRSV